ncbi:hypothetical protein GOODEAATRI_001449 [Goodea atripinnis]|uniref:PDZ domain-containing protein n=1 Tax=Goodea atripinnis TaxID=208336 RepID=A0ABV0MNF5_9TELE
MTLRRNGLGQLGFHVRVDGTVAEVEEYGFAWQAGLRQGSRLVEICKVATVTLTHEQMIDLLRTSVTVKVVIIPPYEESKPRRGCTEEYEMKTMEQKPEPEPLAAGYRPYPRQTWRWESSPIPTGLLSAPNLQRWGPMGPPLPRSQKTLMPVPYREPQHLSVKRYTHIVNYVHSSKTFSYDLFRFGSVQRPLLPFEPHFSIGITSSGESSSGFTSQESTMERCKTGTPASKANVNHSSSNTLSSNASSSHSDERCFDGGPGGERVGGGFLGDPAEPDPDLLHKGGSNDSGIEASTHYNHTHRGNKTSNQPHKPMHPSATYSGFPELSMGRSSNGGESKRRESSPIFPADQNKGYISKTFPLPGSSAEKMDAFKSRSFTPQGYKTPTAEKARPVRASTATPTSAQMGSASLSSSAPKAFYRKSKPSSAFIYIEKQDILRLYFSRQVDTNSKNVFGQPRLRASLRDLRSPRRTYKSTIEDDLKKLIIMDNPDESLCSGRREATFACSESQTNPGDVLFTCTLPTRKHSSSINNSNHSHSKKMPLSASELSLMEMRDKVPPLRRLDPGLMPLPDTASGLEWSSLVNAAKAFEDEASNDLSGRLNQLEVMLKQLNNDLEKFFDFQEKQDKVVLLAEMANLRQNNQRLQEESQTASEQLRKFNTIFTNLKTGSDHEA